MLAQQRSTDVEQTKAHNNGRFTEMPSEDPKHNSPTNAARYDVPFVCALHLLRICRKMHKHECVCIAGLSVWSFRVVSPVKSQHANMKSHTHTHYIAKDLATQTHSHTTLARCKYVWHAVRSQMDIYISPGTCLSTFAYIRVCMCAQTFKLVSYAPSLRICDPHSSLSIDLTTCRSRRPTAYIWPTLLEIALRFV